MKTISWEMNLARCVVCLDLDALPVNAVSRVLTNETSFPGSSSSQLLVATFFEGIL